MARGGHRDMRTVMRYQHAGQKRERPLTSRLDGII
jgi:hypothetical protein